MNANLMKIKNHDVNSVRFAPLLTIDIFLVISYLIPSLITYLNLILRGVTFRWPMFILWLLVISLNKKNKKTLFSSLKKRKSLFLLLFLFILVVAFNYFFVDTNPKSFSYLVTFIDFSFVLVVDSFYSQRPLQYKLSILFYSIIALGVQAIVSIPYLLSADTYVTRMFSSGQLDQEANLEAIKHGVGTNGLYSSIGAIAILGLSVINKIKKKYALLLMIMIVALIFSVIISTFFASILLMIIGFIVLAIKFRGKVFNFKIVLYMILGIVLLTYINKNFIADTNLLRPIEIKIERFLTEKTDVTGRDNLAKISLNTFLDNPFFGIGVPNWRSYDKVGEHMPWIDYLANFGLFGFFPFLIFVFILIKQSLSYFFIKDEMMFYRTACLIGALNFILSSFVSPMITTPSSYIFFFLFFVSFSNTGKLN